MDWGKANLIETRANTLNARRTIDEKYKVLNELLCATNEIHSEALRMLENIFIYWRFIRAVFIHDADFQHKIEELINRINGFKASISKTDQASWSADQQLVEYLRHHDASENALPNLIESTIAELYDIMYRISMDLDDIKSASEYKEKSMEIRRELKQWSSYIIDHRANVEIKILNANSIEEVKEACQELENVYKESVEKLGPTAYELTIRAYTLTKYLACLGIVGDNGKIEELMGSDGWLLSYVRPRTNVTLRLLLGWFDKGFNRPSADEVINAVKDRLQTDLVPALRSALGLKINCSDECGSHSSGLCRSACLAVGGSKDALNELIGMTDALVKNIPEDIRGSSPELSSGLNNWLINYNPSAVIQALAPLYTSTSFTLALNALINDDYEAVRAIAEHVEHAFNVPIPQRLFKNLAVEESDKDSTALTILKLFSYYYYYY